MRLAEGGRGGKGRGERLLQREVGGADSDGGGGVCYVWRSNAYGRRHAGQGSGLREKGETATIAVEAAAAEMAKAMAAAAVAKAIPAVAGSGYMYGGGKLAGNVSKENTTIPNAIPKCISINL